MDAVIARIASFAGCTIPLRISVIVLARNGFVFAGVGDCITCSACDFKLKNWQDVNPIVEHQSERPSCSFVCNSGKENEEDKTEPQSALADTKKDPSQTISIKSEESKTLQAANGSSKTSSFNATIEDITERQQRLQKSGRISEGRIWSSDVLKESNGQLVNTSRDVNSEHYPRSENLSINNQASRYATDSAASSLANRTQLESGSQPIRRKHPQYSAQSDRLNTFRGREHHFAYPLSSPAKLAGAGFFYIGPSDNVRCFTCDGGLKNFQPDDDPLLEHRRWFPKCQYLAEVGHNSEFSNTALVNAPVSLHVGPLFE